MNKDKLVKLLEFDSLGHRQIIDTDDYDIVDDIVISTGASDGPVAAKKYAVFVMPTACEADGIIADWETIMTADYGKESELEYGMPIVFETDSLQLMQRMLHNALTATSDQIAEILSLSDGGVIFEFRELKPMKHIDSMSYELIAAIVGDRHTVDALGEADMDWLNENYWSLFGLTFEYVEDDWFDGCRGEDDENDEEDKPTKVHLA